MYNYDSPVDAMNDLTKRGYNIDFNLDRSKSHIIGNNGHQEVCLSPVDFEIDEFYRFEGDSDPGDEMVVYAISSKKHNLKGILVNAFGPYSDSGSSEVIKKLAAHHTGPQPIGFKRTVNP
jgi:hypothetical protein